MTLSAERFGAYQRARRAAKREAGECRDCKQPATPGRRFCPTHAKRHRQLTREWWKRKQQKRRNERNAS